MAGGQLAATFTVLATDSLRVSQMPSFGRCAAGPPAGHIHSQDLLGICVDTFFA